MENMLACLRACNAALRWSMLHASGLDRKLRAAVTAHGPSMDAVLALALDTAALEHEVGHLHLFYYAPSPAQLSHHVHLGPQVRSPALPIMNQSLCSKWFVCLSLHQLSQC